MCLYSKWATCVGRCWLLADKEAGENSCYRAETEREGEGEREGERESVCVRVSVCEYPHWHKCSAHHTHMHHTPSGINEQVIPRHRLLKSVIIINPSLHLYLYVLSLSLSLCISLSPSLFLSLSLSLSVSLPRSPSLSVSLLSLIPLPSLHQRGGIGESFNK